MDETKIKQISDIPLDVQKTPINEESKKLVKPTEEDITQFFDQVIMQDKPFYKTYKIKDLPVVFRTRTSKETTEVMKLVGNEKSGLDIIRVMCDSNLAFSLSKMGNVDYDNGSIQDRLARFDNIPTIKKSILWDYLSMFDELVTKIRIEHVNF